MALHQKRYRPTPIRLPGWDYTTAGYYFVTLCTYARQLLFGQVVDGEMILSPIGEIANQFWSEIPVHFPNTDLDEFVIMPNHVHGIIVIRERVAAQHAAPLPKQHVAPLPKQAAAPLPEQDAAPLPKQHVAPLPKQAAAHRPDHQSAHLPDHQSAPRPDTPNTPKHLPASGSLSAIIRSYKSAVTRWAGKNGYLSFAWQPRFYDHIIRDDESLDRIRRYIQNNPLNWALDEENPAFRPR